MLYQSQRNFAHNTTVTLSWCVKNFILIGIVHFTPEHYIFWSNFEFNRNIVSGTGASTYMNRFVGVMWPVLLTHGDLENDCHWHFQFIIFYKNWCNSVDQSHKSHNAPVPYHTMHHSEQECAHFCSEWCIVGYRTGALSDWWICPIQVSLEFVPISLTISQHWFR